MEYEQVVRLLGVSHLSGVWTSDRIVAFILGLLLVLLSVGLLLAAWTRWGQSKPLTKCIVLSVLAHLWLLMYAYGTRVVRPGYGPGDRMEAVMEAQWVEEAPPPWNEMTSEQLASVTDSEWTPESSIESLPAELVSAEEMQSNSDSRTVPERSPPEIDTAALDFPQLLATQPEGAMDESVSQSEETASMELAALSDSSPIEVEAPTEQLISATPSPSDFEEPKLSSPTQVVHHPQQNLDLHRIRPIDEQRIPEMYQLRDPNNRRLAVAQFGGDESTEAAVELALSWLARNQEPEGHWDAKKHGAGKETRTLGEDRSGTGSEADTAMTGLSLLSFLGAGHTHVSGPYRETVRKAAVYLMRAQMPSGDLSGPKQIGNDRGVYFARMYSHGMAMLSLAELYALTGDTDLVPVLTRAVEYTLRAQNPTSGGWRYAVRDTGDPGDLSQFGWQALAINSCQASGFELPTETRPRLEHFLNSVRAGSRGGLAVYRPVPGQTPSVPMTAEALASRLILGMPLSSEGEAEAKASILRELPGTGQDNLYCWYYASIALFQFQDEAWRTWNESLKARLVQSQIRQENGLAGSWESTCIWSGYGGRIYSTAMACLCLEVYYRFLPMYRSDQMAQSNSILR